MSDSGCKRSRNEDDSSSDLETAGPRRSGRAPVPRRVLSESPPPARRQAKRTKKATSQKSSHIPSSQPTANAGPPANSEPSSAPTTWPSSPIPSSTMSITPADVPQPTSLIKQARISTAAHDINAFFKKVKGEKTVCVRCQCVSFSFRFRSSRSTQQYFSLLEQIV